MRACGAVHAPIYIHTSACYKTSCHSGADRLDLEIQRRSPRGTGKSGLGVRRQFVTCQSYRPATAAASRYLGRLVVAEYLVQIQLLMIQEGKSSGPSQARRCPPPKGRRGATCNKRKAGVEPGGGNAARAGVALTGPRVRPAAPPIRYGRTSIRLSRSFPFQGASPAFVRSSVC